MLIKSFSDLGELKDGMTADLSELEPKQFMLAIGFLTGLTYQKGSLIKVARKKFFLRLGE